MRNNAVLQMKSTKFCPPNMECVLLLEHIMASDIMFECHVSFLYYALNFKGIFLILQPACNSFMYAGPNITMLKFVSEQQSNCGPTRSLLPKQER